MTAESIDTTNGCCLQHVPASAYASDKGKQRLPHGVKQRERRDVTTNGRSEARIKRTIIVDLLIINICSHDLWSKYILTLAMLAVFHFRHLA